MALSDSWLKATVGKPCPQTWVKTDRDGLSVRISPKGKLVFQLRYRYAKKACRVDIGSYPHISLQAARQECDRLRGELERGHDPKRILLREKHTTNDACTFGFLLNEWYTRQCEPTKASHGEILRSFELYVLPTFGKLLAEDITVQLWLGLLEPLSKEVPSIASRILGNTKQIYHWAVKRELLTNNPLSEISSKTDLQIHRSSGKRVLSDAELRLVWQAIQQSSIRPKNTLMLRLAIVYGCRWGELRQAKKVHIDLDNRVWVVPPENHKMGGTTGKPLVRPIIPTTQQMFETALLLAGTSEYLFPDVDTGEPAGDRAHLALPLNIIKWIKKHCDVEMARWSVHDLRRTARTNFSTLTEPHVGEIMLGHKLPGVWQVYDHHDYLDEQTKAYTAWWERLSRITG